MTDVVDSVVCEIVAKKVAHGDAPDADFVALQFERLADRGLVTRSVH